MRGRKAWGQRCSSGVSVGSGREVMEGAELGLQWEQGLAHCGVPFGVRVLRSVLDTAPGLSQDPQSPLCGHPWLHMALL